MLPGRKSRHQLIHEVFASPPESGVAAAVGIALDRWAHAVRQFEPLIGVVSVNLIFARCIDLNRQLFPWLDPIKPVPQMRSPLADHGINLMAQTPIEVVSASRALLVTFVELLDALIGERLTSVYLRPVLEASASNKEQAGER